MSDLCFATRFSNIPLPAFSAYFQYDITNSNCNSQDNVGQVLLLKNMLTDMYLVFFQLCHHPVVLSILVCLVGTKLTTILV